VILPERNRGALDEVPDEVRERMTRAPRRGANASPAPSPPKCR
jgi:ATP-dependent Lon protease